MRRRSARSFIVAGGLSRLSRSTLPRVHRRHRAGGGNLPALLIASHKDKLVSAVRSSGGLAQALREHHVPVEEVHCDNTAYASPEVRLSRPFRRLAPMLDRVVEFIDNLARPQ